MTLDTVVHLFGADVFVQLDSELCNGDAKFLLMPRLT